ncbi:hypothetical protein [Actinoplanes sp. NPDC049265]|uniref:hypothetical protein n=1 Tax=Actinoplanes sp. NPDC049265 TaxID=3363902 RepID=UPI0037120F54
MSSRPTEPRRAPASAPRPASFGEQIQCPRGFRRLLPQYASVRAEFLIRCVEVLGGRLAAVRRQQALAGPCREERTKVPRAPVLRP